MDPRCDRLDDLEISSYLDDPNAERWRSLRAHVESCDDCRIQIETVRKLRTSFESASETHPSEDLLVRFADERESLPSTVADEMERHLADCVSCRDELDVLSSIRIVPPREPTIAEQSLRPSEWHRVLAALAGPGWHPLRAAAAFALLIAVTLPLVRTAGRPVAGLPGSDELTAENEARTEAATEGRQTMQKQGETHWNALGYMGNGMARSSAPDRSAYADASKSAAPVPAPAPEIQSSGVSERGEPRSVAPALSRTDMESEPRRARAQALMERAPRGARAVDAAGDASKARLRTPPASTSRTLTVAYVPAGRILLQSGSVGSMRISMMLVRASTAESRDPASGDVASEEPKTIEVPRSVERLAFRFTTAGEAAESHDIPLAPEFTLREVRWSVAVAIRSEWIARGENRFEILNADDGSAIAPPFLVEIE